MLQEVGVQIAPLQDGFICSFYCQTVVYSQARFMCGVCFCNPGNWEFETTRKIANIRWVIAKNSKNNYSRSLGWTPFWARYGFAPAIEIHDHGTEPLLHPLRLFWDSFETLLRLFWDSFASFLCHSTICLRSVFRLFPNTFCTLPRSSWRTRFSPACFHEVGCEFTGIAALSHVSDGETVVTCFSRLPFTEFNQPGASNRGVAHASHDCTLLRNLCIFKWWDVVNSEKKVETRTWSIALYLYGHWHHLSMKLIAFSFAIQEDGVCGGEASWKLELWELLTTISCGTRSFSSRKYGQGSFNRIFFAGWPMRQLESLRMFEGPACSPRFHQRWRASLDLTYSTPSDVCVPRAPKMPQNMAELL